MNITPLTVHNLFGHEKAAKYFSSWPFLMIHECRSRVGCCGTVEERADAQAAAHRMLLDERLEGTRRLHIKFDEECLARSRASKPSKCRAP